MYSVSFFIFSRVAWPEQMQCNERNKTTPLKQHCVDLRRLSGGLFYIVCAANTQHCFL